MRLLPNSRSMSAGFIATAALLMSAPALADAPVSERPIADKAPFQACLDGATPTTENIPAVDISGLDTIPDDEVIMDTNPHWDEVVLDFADHVSDERIQAFAQRFGLQVQLNSPFSADANVYTAKVQEGAVPYVKDCLRLNAPQGKIEHIEENFLYRIPDSFRASLSTEEHDQLQRDMEATDVVPDDPLYQFQWNFKQVGAEQAWEHTAGKGAVVAVIDTGVTMEDAPDRGIKVGQDLQGVQRVSGYDFVDNSDFVYDGHGHGTHVAGTIAQATDNGYGVAGLAYDASIMPLRVLNDQGFGSVADIADAVRFAADNGADIINMSLGGPLPSLVLSRAVKYAHKNGTTVIAAAGNSGKKAPSYPAAYKHAIAVAATQYDQHTTFYSQWGDFVDIAAPGGNTRVDQNDDGRPDGILQETHPRGGHTDRHEFALYMGTSMASPHVAAAAAMVHSSGVTNPDAIKRVLQNTADDSMREHYSDQEFTQRYGAGLLQVDRAVQAASTSIHANADRSGERRDAEPLVRCGVVDAEEDALLLQGLDHLTSQFQWNHGHTSGLVGGLLLALLALLGLRRRERLDDLSRSQGFTLVATAGATAGALGIITALASTSGLVASAAALATNPLSISGLASTLHLGLASFLVPLGAYALMAGRPYGRAIATGVGFGVASFSLASLAYLAFSGTVVAASTPVIAMASGLLVLNALLSAAIGYFGIQRK